MSGVSKDKLDMSMCSIAQILLCNKRKLKIADKVNSCNDKLKNDFSDNFN